jgi:type II secretory pathway component PulF
VSVDVSKPVGPGVYEVLSTVKSGDASKLTLQDFQRGIADKYGDNVEVLTYETQGTQARVFFKVHQPRTNQTSSKGEIRAAFIAPLIITLVGLVSVGFLWWQIQVEVKEGYKVVDDVLEKPGAQVAAGGFGIGAAALGVAALLYVLTRKGRANGET